MPRRAATEESRVFSRSGRAASWPKCLYRRHVAAGAQRSQPLADALPNARLVTLRGVDHFATPKDFGCLDAALEFLGAAP